MRKGIYPSLFLLLLVCSCSTEQASEVVTEENPKALAEIATLKTNEAQDVSSSQAIIWGVIESNGGSSVYERGVCYGKIANPTHEDTIKKASVTKASGEFKVDLSDLEEGTVYYARAYVVNDIDIAYGNEISFRTEELASQFLSIGEIKVAGAQDLFLDVELKDHGDLAIQEIGLVYDTSKQPNIEDNKISRDIVENKFKQRISNLTQQTIYYVKPYILTDQGLMYGEQISISTIKKGNFTYSINQNGADLATLNRIKEAFDLATEYYNNFTSIEKHVTVNYSSDTPTADANFSGWINVGSKPDYQRAGTAMHEMAHSVGVGTHAKYWELMYDGFWHGDRANEILQMMTNDTNAVVKGDGLHFWPFGINGSWEDDGSDFLYIMNALILQGMKADGLPSN
ncbi:hypothetical protein [Tenacibaculum sp.]|uniref:hypothetical protein n=1 Tax=Tenacibaculum sp. TaxID=1906242 RepID=UPI003D0DB856